MPSLPHLPKLSSKKSGNLFAEMCGVSHTFVDAMQPQVATVATSTRTGKDGKHYPASRPRTRVDAEEQDADEQAEDDADEKSRLFFGENYGRRTPESMPRNGQNDPGRDARASEERKAMKSPHLPISSNRKSGNPSGGAGNGSGVAL